MMEMPSESDKGTREKLLSNLIEKLLNMGEEMPSGEKEMGEGEPSAEIKAMSMEIDPEMAKKKMGM